MSKRHTAEDLAFAIIAGTRVPFHYRGTEYCVSGSLRRRGDQGNNWLKVVRTDGRKIKGARVIGGGFAVPGLSDALECAARRALEKATIERAAS